jgi:RNA polymerase sigma factor (sigma-70 family)
VLGDAHEAEDCFQAAFLALARRAHAVRRGAALAAWLHAVARHVALRAHAARQRCHPAARSRLLAEQPDAHADPLAEVSVRELLTALDEEVQRLPEVYRLPVLLCCLEGKTHEEAARQLGWTPGSLQGRLERGRARLRAQLAKRGLALSAALAVVGVSRGATEVSAALAANTVRAALTGRVAAEVAALVDETLRAGTPGRFPIAPALALVFAAVSLGLGVALLPPAGQKAVWEKPAPRSIPVGVRAGNDRYGDPLPPRALARLGTVRFRHGDQVNQIALSPDGKSLVSASRDKTVRVWDLATGREVRRFGPAARDALSVAFSPGGTLLASI